MRLVDLEPVRGSEANKRRPAVVVSNDQADATAGRLGRGVITGVPLTSNIDRVFVFQALLPAAVSGLRMDSRPRRSRSAQLRSSESARCWETSLRSSCATSTRRSGCT